MKHTHFIGDQKNLTVIHFEWIYLVCYRLPIYVQNILEQL